MSIYRIRKFVGDPGSTEVSHLVIKAEGDDFYSQVRDLKSTFDSIVAAHGQTPVFARVFLSDAANQASAFGGWLDCPVSIVEQAPMCPCKCMALFIMESGRDGASPHVFSASRAPQGDSYTATAELLETYASEVDLNNECVRTWFFVNDIDNNYAGMVRARNEIFDRCGLTRDTHFIASTGIAGRGADCRCPVTFDAYAIHGLTSGRVTYLKALDHLNPTMDYGVAFERATAVDFADRRMILVSGTASIDNRGEILYPGDVVAQTGRMLENVEALLAEGGAGIDDLMHAIVYLRDTSDYLTVEKELRKYLPEELPLVIVHAAVCRPGWLIEMECMAMNRRISDNNYPAF